MGARGPAPKPTALKKLAGNPGKRALNANEPVPRGVKPKMPPHLSADAQQEWKRLVRTLSGMRVLTSADADALAMYCDAYCRWKDAAAKLAEQGMVVMVQPKKGKDDDGDDVTTVGGYPVMSPYVTIVNQSMRVMKQLLGEFGMTPASRSRISVPEKPEVDDFEQFLRRR